MNIAERISLILIDKGFNLSPNYKTEKIINDASKLKKTSEEILITSEKQEIRKICYFNLTFDHRAVDGFPASKFLESIIKNIQNPEALESK